MGGCVVGTGTPPEQLTPRLHSGKQHHDNLPLLKVFNLSLTNLPEVVRRESSPTCWAVVP